MIKIKTLVQGAVVWLMFFLIISPYLFNSMDPLFYVITYTVMSIMFLFCAIYALLIKNILDRRRAEEPFKIVIALLLALSYFTYGMEGIFPVLSNISTSLDWILVSTFILWNYKTSPEINR